MRDSAVFFRLLILLLLTAVASGSALAEAGDEPRLRDIVITGNDKTDPGVILRLMDLETGQPFDLDVMDAAWDALEDSGHFQFVDLYDEEDADGNVTLHVKVEEDLSTYYGPLIRPGLRHKYQLGAWLEERNLRGKAETLRLEASAVYLQRALIAWDRPWLAGVRGLSARVAAEGEAADFVFRPMRYRKWDTGLDVRWNFSGPWFVRTGATYGHFLQRDDFVDETTGALHAAGGENHWRLEAAAGLDSRNNPSFPSRGVFVEAAVRRWESNGFEAYTETDVDARLFVTVPWAKHIVAVRGWSRSTDGAAHLDNRLFHGGPASIRGYAYGTLEGDEGWLASLEYRIPLFLMPISPQGDLLGFGLHLFADAGDTWAVDDGPGRPAQGYGGGAHVILDALQLRFEGARDRDGDWRYQFMNGFNF